METPDRWILVEITPEGEEPFIKVFATWAGGYTTGDSWRLNSGVETVQVQDPYFIVESASGTLYKLHKEGYGVAGGSNYGVLARIEELGAKPLDNPPESWYNTQKRST